MKIKTMMARVNPKLDLVFKKLFGSEENKDILMSLINAILPEDQPVVDITLKNPYNVSDYTDGKLSILDIKAEDEKGYIYDIEMQVKGSSFYGKRTLYYWAKIFGSQLDYFEVDENRKKKNRKNYEGLSKCIVISLMNFDFFKDDKYHRCFMLKDRDSNEIHQDLDYLDLYFVELAKFEKKYETIKTTLDRWITFLNNADLYSKNDLPEELAEIESIKKANERLEVMHFDFKERAIYEGQQKRFLDDYAVFKETLDKATAEAREAGLEAGLEAGVEQGREEEKKSIAKKLIALDLSNETIASSTGLTIAEIETLRKSKDK